MRSVFFHFPARAAGPVRGWLDEHATRLGKDEWQLPPGASPRVWCRLDRDFVDWSEAERQSLHEAVGEPSALVQADVSGRIPGHAEVEALWRGLFSVVPAGRMQDDHGSHLWTLEEIEGSARIEGRRFFEARDRSDAASD